MKFTDKKASPETAGLKGSNVIISVALHIIVIALGLIAFSGSAAQPMGGDEIISVDMVVLSEAPVELNPTHTADPVAEPPEEVVPDIQEPVEPATAVEEVVEETIEEPPEITPEPEIHPEPPEETVQPEETPELAETELPEETSTGFATIEATGSAGGGVPGPGTYESRVFNAIRRGFRTSLKPEQTYRVIVTVSPSGVLSYETLRNSGVSGFDRAVRNALAIAQIPPNVSRTVVTINIEFEGIK